MSSEFSCIFCKGKNFRKGYFEAEYERFCEYEQYNETKESEVKLKLVSEVKREHHWEMIYDHSSEMFSYICEECGFIMTFTNEKQVESKHEEKERKTKEDF